MRKKVLCVTTAIILGLTLNACGKKNDEKKVQDVKGDIEVQTDDESKLYHIDEEIEDESMGIYYDIDVSINPEQKKVPMYQLKLLDMNEENIATYCDELFDEGSYEIIKPYHVMSDEELKTVESELESEVSTYSEETLPIYIEEQYNAVRCERYERALYVNRGEEGIKEGKRNHEYETYNADKIIHTSLNGYGNEEQDGMVRGMIEGKRYFIQFKKQQYYESEFTKSEYLLIPEDAKIKYQLAKRLSEDEMVDDSEMIKQQQQASLEMVKLGYKDYDCVSVYGTKSVARDNSFCPENHYCFVFGYNLDGCIQNEYQTNILGWEGDSGIFVNPNIVYIFTDDNGIACVEFSARYEIEKKIETYDNYIGGERVKKGLNNNLNSGVLDYGFDSNGKVTVDEADFGYMLYYDNGIYILSPTWTYVATYNQNKSKVALTAVGAYDGLVICTICSLGDTNGIYGKYGNEPPAYYDEEVKD